MTMPLERAGHGARHVADREIHLKLADDLEGFLTQLRGQADTAGVEDRQHLLRLLVNDVLIGPEKITIRHRIPVRERTGPREPRGDSAPDTEGDHRRSYPLRWGVVSPLLLNIALHGMEQAAGVRYQVTGTHAGDTVSGSPVLIRYADDLVALCHTRDEAQQVKARLAGWLAPRGLTFNEDKTRIVTLDDGFDFLGFTVRRQSDKLLIKPSKAALRRIRERLRTEMRALRGANATAVIARLNPIIRGWAAYYRTVVSSDAFTVLDRYLWRLTYKWAKHGHPNKPRHWII